MKQTLQPVNRITPIRCTYDECREYTRTYAKSFYFSSFLLPKDKRAAAYAIYTFCRYADNIVDSGGPVSTEAVRARFDPLEEFLEDVYGGKSFSGNNFSAFAETVRKYRIPKHYFTELIDGVCMDTVHNRYEKFVELEEY